MKVNETLQSREQYVHYVYHILVKTMHGCIMCSTRRVCVSFNACILSLSLSAVLR